MGDGTHESRGLVGVGSVLTLLGSMVSLGARSLLFKLFVVAVFETGSYSSLAGNLAFILPQHASDGITGVNRASCLPFKFNILAVLSAFTLLHKALPTLQN